MAASHLLIDWWSSLSDRQACLHTPLCHACLILLCLTISSLPLLFSFRHSTPFLPHISFPLPLPCPSTCLPVYHMLCLAPFLPNMPIPCLCLSLEEEGEDLHELLPCLCHAITTPDCPHSLCLYHTHDLPCHTCLHYLTHTHYTLCLPFDFLPLHYSLLPYRGRRRYLPTLLCAHYPYCY